MEKGPKSYFKVQGLSKLNIFDLSLVQLIFNLKGKNLQGKNDEASSVEFEVTKKMLPKQSGQPQGSWQKG